MSRLMKAIIMPSTIVLLPVLGNLSMFSTLNLWIVWGACILGSLLQPSYRVTVDKSNAKDTGTEFLIIWAVVLTQLSAIVETSYFRFEEISSWNCMAWIGLTLIIIGLGLRTWAIHTLGRFFTMHLALQADHKIIQSGPYKYFRHPSYVGAFFLYIGTILTLHAWCTLTVAIVILPIVWWRRMHYEEKMLIEKFGEDYRNYCKGAKRFIPGIW